MPPAADGLRALVVGDDALRRKLLRYLLLEAGYDAAAVPAVAAAIPLLERDGVDLLLLDGHLPAAERLACCRRLRAARAAVAILCLTPRRDVEARVEALAAGADDCLPCPFDPRELLARAGALLRRRPGPGAAAADAALTLGVSRLSLEVGDGCRVALAPRELRLLRVLLQHAGRVCAGDALRRAVWGPEEGESNLLEVYIGRLRRKLAALEAPARIETVRGVGYRLYVDRALPADAPPAADASRRSA